MQEPKEVILSSNGELVIVLLSWHKYLKPLLRQSNDLAQFTQTDETFGLINAIFYTNTNQR